ncbi:hypothetical protein BGX38DRAFT_1211002 [Terfezia claveryi]|nr:hypothetical protein BGX38DRAFT_1211002 [Terfezia claveryi]
MAHFNFITTLFFISSVVGLAATMPANLDIRHPAPHVDSGSIAVRQIACPELFVCCAGLEVTAACLPLDPAQLGCPSEHAATVCCTEIPPPEPLAAILACGSALLGL